MELREPKKKRVGPHIKPQLPFPVMIESESGLPIDYELWPLYTGSFIGDIVVVNNSEEMISLYTMGYFGKGSFSRGYPSFSLSKKGIPPVIKERQWQRRKLWMDRIKKSFDCSSVGSPEENTKENEEKNYKRSSHCKVSDTLYMEVDTTEVSELKPEPDTDLGNMDLNLENKNNFKSHEYSKFDGSEQESTIDCNYTDCIDRVLVLDDSDSEDLEKVIRDPNPHLEVEPFKTVLESLNLTLEESFFLSYALGCLQVFDISGQLLSITQMWQIFSETKPDFIELYVVYHYFRAKGWVVKTGYKFGGHFLLYKQGPPFYHASYVVLVEKVDYQLKMEKDSLTWTKLHGLNRLAENSGKDIIRCQVVFPRNLSQEDLKTPTSLPKFQVNEILMKRWVSSQERAEKEET